MTSEIDALAVFKSNSTRARTVLMMNWLSLTAEICRRAFEIPDSQQPHFRPSIVRIMRSNATVVVVVEFASFTDTMYAGFGDSVPVIFCLWLQAQGEVLIDFVVPEWSPGLWEGCAFSWSIGASFARDGHASTFSTDTKSALALKEVIACVILTIGSRLVLCRSEEISGPITIKCGEESPSSSRSSCSEE